MNEKLILIIFSLIVEFIRFVRRPDREGFLRHCNDLLGPDHSKVQRSEKEMTSESSGSTSGWIAFSSSLTNGLCINPPSSDSGFRR